MSAAAFSLVGGLTPATRSNTAVQAAVALLVPALLTAVTPLRRGAIPLLLGSIVAVSAHELRGRGGSARRDPDRAARRRGDPRGRGPRPDCWARGAGRGPAGQEPGGRRAERRIAARGRSRRAAEAAESTHGASLAPRPLSDRGRHDPHPDPRHRGTDHARGGRPGRAPRLGRRPPASSARRSGPRSSVGRAAPGGGQRRGRPGRAGRDAGCRSAPSWSAASRCRAPSAR